MGVFSDLVGTLLSTFKIGRATLDASGLTAQRTIALPDQSGALLPASAGTLTGYRETVVAQGTVTASATTISLAAGNVHTITCSGSGAMTWTISGAPATGTAGSLTIIATNAGLRTITVTGGVWLPEAPTLPDAGVALINAITVDAGATWYLTAVGQ